jgi:hypothetical protein
MLEQSPRGFCTLLEICHHAPLVTNRCTLLRVRAHAVGGRSEQGRQLETISCRSVIHATVGAGGAPVRAMDCLGEGSLTPHVELSGGGGLLLRRLTTAGEYGTWVVRC